MTDKKAIQYHFDSIASERHNWFYRNFLYHNQIIQVCRPFLNSDSRVLELGCSTGDLLAELKPGFGVGIDMSERSIEFARGFHPYLHFICADVENLSDDPLLEQPFDVIVLADLISYIHDIEVLFDRLHTLCHPGTRIIVSHWNWMWQPVLRVGEFLRLKSPDIIAPRNWLSSDTLMNFLELTDYEMLEARSHLLLPYEIPGISPVINTFSHAPLVHKFSLLKTVVARPLPRSELKESSVTVVIPTRNEAGNIARAVENVPEMGTHTELLFIDGNSTDGTIEEIEAQIAAHPERDIKLIHQVPRSAADDAPPNLMLKLGKGDAVRKAFAAANGDILMILDSDLTVPPEDLPKFYSAITSGKGRFVNGTRFVYKQQAEAMKPLNMLGNVFFSKAFSWLLGQTVTDTLCGTKVLYKADYELIAANRGYFGDFDPFGDFDLLFGAARLGMRIIEVPVRYQARTYGESKVRVALHGPLLGHMSLLGLWHFKVRRLLPGQPPIIQPMEGERVSTAKAANTTWLWAGLTIFLLWLLFRKSRRNGR